MKIKVLVKCYAVPDNAPGCLVFLLNIYMKHLPKYAFQNDVLYLRPKIKWPSDPDAPRFEEKCVGKNTFASMMKDISGEAGLSMKQTITCVLQGQAAFSRLMFQRE